MSLPTAIILVLAHFAPAFTTPTWQRAQVLLVGTLLAHGRRTVTAALRASGHATDPHFASYHQVLNRAVWDPLDLSFLLLLLLLTTFLPTASELTFAADEHLERRWGPRIAKRGHYRDPARSSKGHAVSSSGLRWLVFALVVPLPWTPYEAALPFLTILLTPPAVDAAARQRHKTVPEWTMQVVRLLRRWLPNYALVLVGDGAYSVLDLAALCVQERVTLIAPLPADAGLYDPPLPRAAQTSYKPRVVGTVQPKLQAVLDDPQTVWTAASIPWYREAGRAIEWVSGRALWYRGGKVPVPIRWVIVRDPTGQGTAHIYFATMSDADTAAAVKAARAARAVRVWRRRQRVGVAAVAALSGPRLAQSVAVVAAAAPATASVPAAVAAAVVVAPAGAVVAAAPAPPVEARAVVSGAWAEEEAGTAVAAALGVVGQYQKRWAIEVTFEESRAHLGVNTQRQWSEKAIARSTPLLLGLYSLVLVLGQALHPDGRMPVGRTAWYPKQVPTFSDVLVSVRRHLWGAEAILHSGEKGEGIMLGRAEYERLLAVACGGAG